MYTRKKYMLPMLYAIPIRAREGLLFVYLVKNQLDYERKTD